jgi:hypothetical protein
MAKMFYTIEEVATKLGKSEDDIREMANSGQIQEFRDRDKLMFKVEQIDLLAGGDEDTGEVHLELEDTAGASGLALSGSGIPLSDSQEGTGTGISVFDTDHGGEDDAEQTAVGDAFEEDLSLEAVGSGSGLLDLTRESDDTSLGAELLEEVYSGDDNIEIPANASGLFEASAPEPIEEEAVAAAGIASMPMVVETYDGSGSGLTVGLMVGALAALVAVGVVVIVGIFGATPELAMTMTKSSNSVMIWGGGLFGATLIFGLIGWFIGKSSE